MPRSLAPGTVDIVSALEEIGPVLKNLISSTAMPEQISENEGRELERFLEELHRNRGVDFRSYKRPTILRRLGRRMAATGCGSIEEYSAYLEEHPEEYRQLLNALLIKVTEFFRDPELFDYLKGKVLPELIEEAREDENQLRIWSAGCATGEEAYSLRDGGYLVMGKAESPAPVADLFAPVDRHNKVYRRQGQRFLLPPTLPTSPAPRARVERTSDDRRANRAQTEIPQPSASRNPGEDLFNLLPVGVVVVAHDYSIEAINAAARRMLSIPGVGVEVQALQDLLEVAVPDDISTELSTSGVDSLLSDYQRGQLYLILREAVRNAVKHSGCRRLTVGLDITSEEVSGYVEDDGPGFVDNGGTREGLGLRSIRERAALLEGTAEVYSSHEGGGGVRVLLPLRNGRG
jgi:PAS domain-containing protein